MNQEESCKSVSIILPTYNRRNYLGDAIRSILNQTYSNWKLLVINDGGEDISDIVKSFNDERVVYHNRPHEGKAAALNFGLSLVSSKYVAYMDDDDLVYPEHIASLVEIAEQKQADFVYSDTWVIVISPEGEEVHRYIENAQDVTFEDIKFFNKINHKQILHTKKISDQVGPYDTRMRILIDYDYIRRLALQTTPIHFKKITGEHYLRQSNTNKNSAITRLWECNPTLCGQSILALFDKDLGALAEFYRYAYALKNESDELNKKCDYLSKALHNTSTSFSYRIGRAITFPLRVIIDLFSKNCR